MPLEKHEDFLDLSIERLTNYLSGRGKKVELVARAFATSELKMNIIASSEEEKLKLQSDNQEIQVQNQRYHAILSIPVSSRILQ